MVPTSSSFIETIWNDFAFHAQSSSWWNAGLLRLLRGPLHIVLLRYVLVLLIHLVAWHCLIAPIIRLISFICYHLTCHDFLGVLRANHILNCWYLHIVLLLFNQQVIHIWVIYLGVVGAHAHEFVVVDEAFRFHVVRYLQLWILHVDRLAVWATHWACFEVILALV